MKISIFYKTFLFLCAPAFIMFGIATSSYASTDFFSEHQGRQSSPHPAFAKSGLVVGVDAGYATLDASPFVNSIVIPAFATEQRAYKYQLLGAVSSVIAFSGFIGYNFSVLRNCLINFHLGYLVSNKTHLQGNSFFNPDWLSPPTFFDHVNAYLSIKTPYLTIGTQYIFSNRLNVFASAGVAYVFNKAKIVFPSDNDGNSLSRTQKYLQPLLKIGVGYLLTQNLDLHVYYQRLFGNSDKKSIATIDNNPDGAKAWATPGYRPTFNILGIGLSYTF